MNAFLEKNATRFGDASSVLLKRVLKERNIVKIFKFFIGSLLMAHSVCGRRLCIFSYSCLSRVHLTLCKTRLGLRNFEHLLVPHFEINAFFEF